MGATLHKILRVRLANIYTYAMINSLVPHIVPNDWYCTWKIYNKWVISEWVFFFKLYWFSIKVCDNAKGQ